MSLAIAIMGWCAAMLILAAYILLSLERISGSSSAYQWMNVVGAAGFIVNSGYNGAWPSATLNIVWMAIGGWTLWRIFKRQRSST